MNKKTKSKNWQRVLAIAALWPIAVAKPILDVFGETPEYWAANRIDDFTIISVALLLSILVPIVAAGVLAILGLSSRTQKLSSFLFGLTFIVLFTIASYHTLSLQLGKPLGLIFGCFVLSISTFILYLRFDATRLFFSIFSTAVLLVPISFLMLGPTSELLQNSDRTEATIESQVELDAPLVVVLFDEMSLASLINSDGEIDARLFPNFSRLAGMSTWFRNATTNYGMTQWALPSFLTGKFQVEEIPGTSYKQNPINLFTLVKASDDVFVVEPVTNLCPPEVCGVRSKKLTVELRHVFGDFWLAYQNIIVPDRYLSSIASIPKRFRNLASMNLESQEPEFEVEDILGIGEMLENRFRDGNRKSMIFLHFLLPHAPYIMNPDGSRYTTIDNYGMTGWTPESHVWDPDAQFYLAQAFQRHLLQTMYADLVLGQILDGLENSTLLNESTVVVTADHGVAFKRGEQRRSDTLALAVKGEVNAIPFFWKSSEQTAPRLETRNVELIDFLPTLLEELGGTDSGIFLDGASVKSKVVRSEKVFHGEKYPGDLWQDVLEARGRLFEMIDIVKNDDGSFFPQPAEYNNLIGLQVADLATSDIVIEVENALIFSELDRVGKNQSITPNYVTGWLPSDSGIDTIGIVVNGVMVDVVDVFKDKKNGLSGFHSVFNPSTLKFGKNTLEFVAVQLDPSQQLSLTLLGTGRQSFRLSEGVIVDANNNPLEKNQARLGGVIDSIEFSIPGAAYVRGWMADKSGWKPPTAFLLSYKGEQQLSQPSELRTDLIKINEKLIHAGFLKGFRLRGEPFDPGQLQIYVVFDNSSYAEMKVPEVIKQ